MKVLTFPLVGVLMLVAGQAGAVGFQSVTVPDPTDKPLEVGIWYPSDAPVPSRPNTPFRQALALDGAVAGDRLPLVVMSHGAGGWLGAHADTAFALAEAGFVAVAVNHTGDNHEDTSYPAPRWMADRPRHVGRVLDHMLADWPGRRRIDPSRVGIFGFSAGGFTALVTIGGVPNLKKAAAHCADEPGELLCRFDGAGGFAAPAVASRPASAWVHDSRVKAAVIAAPGFGFAFDARALARVATPVQLWAATGDRNVPSPSNAAVIRRSLPASPDFRRVEGAGHFAFLPPCPPGMRAALPEVHAVVCVDAPGFDRAAFHRRFNREVAAFFGRTLAVR